MASNTMGRLTDLLFQELDRLEAMDMSDPNEVATEIKRAKAMQAVAKEINESAKTVLEHATLKVEYSRQRVETPKLLEG